MIHAPSFLAVDGDILNTALATLTDQRRVVIEEHPEHRAVYLTPLHIAEINVAIRLKTLLSSPKQLSQIDIEKAIEWVQQVNKIELAEMQKEALMKTVSGKVMVITGGPGTGKTTLVNSIIKILGKKEQRIALASPTGRAAKRLSEVTGREAKTIHRLLEFSPSEGGFKRNEENPAVVIPLLPQHYIMLQRNLLYTAITRAKRLVVLVGGKRAIAIAIKNNKVQFRYTNLGSRLNKG